MRMWRRNPFRNILAAAALTVCWLLPAGFGEEGTREQVIDAWLALGPFPEPWPAFHSDKQKGFGAEDLLKFEEIDITSVRPKVGKSLQWLDGTAVAWKEIKTGEKGVGLTAQPAALSTAYLGAYIEVSRWIRTRITVTSPQLIQVYLDGKLIATKSKADKPEKTGATNGEGKVAADAKLETGKHVFIIKTVYDPEFRTDWRVKASFEIAEKYASPGLQFSLLPEGRISLRHLFDGRKPAGISISPDGTFLVFSVAEEGEKDSDNAKRYQTLEDRQPGWRNRSYLYKLTLTDRLRRKLTAGELSTNLNAVSPDGTKLLFSRTIVDYKERPYSKKELYFLDLATLKEELVWKGKWFTRAEWSPDGKKLLFLGGPSLFGVLGVNAAKGLVPNEYNTQAYLYDIAAKRAEAVTRDFDSSISQAFWVNPGDTIYFTTTDRSFAHIYEYSLKRKAFALIESGVESVDQIDIALTKPVAAFIGSGPTAPAKAFLLDLNKKEARLLRDPGKNEYADVRFGRVEPGRVGCIGASYGGFMTMLILTRTNIFASAIAHAGISSISSYWGEDYWGYSYSAVATADSFPWNRKDIYVDQSPLFNADKITTPLLLLHGTVDTNVPPGESAQLFTALKLLGREVEYIQFFDQNHLILTYNKKILWTKTIMAWFDRWLKGQPEWWSDLYANK